MLAKIAILCCAIGIACSQLPCGGNLKGPEGVFTSPNWPDKYPNDASCTWNIEVAEGEAIELSFEDFELELAIIGECVDYVRVTDGQKQLGEFCGNSKPPVLYSSGNKLQVIFKTDESVTYRGFLAIYKALNDTDLPPTTTGPATTAGPTSNPSCSSEVTADSGFVTSPNYPNNYPNEADCSYVMRLASGGRIALEFADFQTEHDDACQYDYVTIHDGDNSGAKLLGKFCGSATSRIVASGDVIFMRFVTDEADAFRGFNATFKKASCENLGGTCAKSCDVAELDYACDAGLKCCQPKLVPDLCGKRPTEQKAVHIVGGTEAKPNSWPWQISLQNNNRFHYCGAVLYNYQWVVTAAHCVHDETTVNVVLGEHDRQRATGNEVRVRASRIIIHPKFVNSAPWPNDIALLKLDSPLKPSPYYSPVCLPDSLDEAFMPNDTCYISGWGDTKGTGNRLVLNELLIAPNTNEECRNKWGSDSILDTNICVGNGEAGSCQGDSGGPLVCKKKDRWVLAGVTSWGVNGCRTRGLPSVYTRISRFLDWMRKNMI